MSRVKFLAFLVALLVFSTPAWAFFQENQSNTRVASGTTVTLPIPSSITNGDLLITFVVETQTTNTAAPNMTAPSGGTGTWSFDSTLNGAVSWYGQGSALGNGKVGVVIHTFHTGDTAPTVGNGGTSVEWQAITTAYWGASGVDKTAAGTPNSSSTSVTFPSITPSAANEELIYFATAYTASNNVANNPHIVSCSSQTDDLDYETSTGAGNPEGYYYDVNEGPCSVGAVTAPTFTLTSATSNMGVALAITPVAFAAVTNSPITTVSGSLARNLQGSFYYSSVNANPNQAPSILFNKWIDGVALYTSWNQNETNACDEYAWDLLDNWVINARTLGLKLKVSFAAGETTPCGSAGEIACPNAAFPPTVSGPNDAGGSNAPVTWINGSNTCTNSHAMAAGSDYINSFWNQGFGTVKGNKMNLYDPADVFYQHALDRFQAAAATRYSGIGNIIGFQTTGMNAGTAETFLVVANNNTTITCSGNTTQCTAICGGASCTVTVTDGTQWLAMPIANHCTGSGTPYAGCTGVGTGSVGSYSTTGVSTCGGGSATQPFIKCDEEPGFEHFFTAQATDWPNITIRFSAAGKASPDGTFAAPNTDTFTNDMITWMASNYGNRSGVESHGLGWSSSGHVFFNAAQGNGYLNPAVSQQPTLSLGFQEVSQQSNVVGADCTPPDWATGSQAANALIVPHANNSAFNQYLTTAGGTSAAAEPNWNSSCPAFNNTCTDGGGVVWTNKGAMFQGTAATDCVATETYSILNTSMFPYNEWYPATLNTAADQPWIKLLHDYVWSR